jgi:hypothetical protein
MALLQDVKLVVKKGSGISDVGMLNLDKNLPLIHPPKHHSKK